MGQVSGANGCSEQFVCSGGFDLCAKGDVMQKTEKIYKNILPSATDYKKTPAFAGVNTLLEAKLPVWGQCRPYGAFICP